MSDKTNEKLSFRELLQRRAGYQAKQQDMRNPNDIQAGVRSANWRNATERNTYSRSTSERNINAFNDNEMGDSPYDNRMDSEVGTPAGWQEDTYMEESRKQARKQTKSVAHQQSLQDRTQEFAARREALKQKIKARASASHKNELEGRAELVLEELGDIFNEISHSDDANINDASLAFPEKENAIADSNNISTKELKHSKKQLVATASSPDDLTIPAKASENLSLLDSSYQNLDLLNNTQSPSAIYSSRTSSPDSKTGLDNPTVSPDSSNNDAKHHIKNDLSHNSFNEESPDCLIRSIHSNNLYELDKFKTAADKDISQETYADNKVASDILTTSSSEEKPVINDLPQQGSAAANSVEPQNKNTRKTIGEHHVAVKKAMWGGFASFGKSSYDYANDEELEDKVSTFKNKRANKSSLNKRSKTFISAQSNDLDNDAETPAVSNAHRVKTKDELLKDALLKKAAKIKEKAALRAKKLSSRASDDKKEFVASFSSYTPHNMPVYDMVGPEDLGLYNNAPAKIHSLQNIASGSVNPIDAATSNDAVISNDVANCGGVANSSSSANSRSIENYGASATPTRVHTKSRVSKLSIKANESDTADATNACSPERDVDETLFKSLGITTLDKLLEQGSVNSGELQSKDMSSRASSHTKPSKWRNVINRAHSSDGSFSNEMHAVNHDAVSGPASVSLMKTTQYATDVNDTTASFGAYLPGLNFDGDDEAALYDAYGEDDDRPLGRLSKKSRANSKTSATSKRRATRTISIDDTTSYFGHIGERPNAVDGSNIGEDGSYIKSKDIEESSNSVASFLSHDPFARSSPNTDGLAQGSESYQEDSLDKTHSASFGSVYSANKSASASTRSNSAKGSLCARSTYGSKSRIPALRGGRTNGDLTQPYNAELGIEDTSASFGNIESFKQNAKRYQKRGWYQNYGDEDYETDEAPKLDSDVSKAFNYMVGLLSRREYSEKELKSKASQRFTEDAITEALVKLKDMNYQSDERYANMLVRNTEFSHYGPQRLKAKASQKGIDRELIDESLNEVDWDSHALKVLIKKYGTKPLDFKERNKALAFLSRRGFDYDTCIKALERLNNGEIDE